MKPTLRTIRISVGSFATLESSTRSVSFSMQEGEKDAEAVRRYIAEQRHLAARILSRIERLEADLNAALEG